MLAINKINKNILIFLVYLFPLTFVLGNLIINLFIFFICILGIIYFKKNLFLFNEKKIITLFSLFFLIILFSTNINHLDKSSNDDWLKSLLFLRYFFLMIIISKLIFYRELNINFFFTSCLIVSLFVCVDISIQFIFGKDIFGNEPLSFARDVKYYSGVFNKELIAGAFILMFSILGLFALLNLLKNYKKINLFIVFSLFVTYFLFSLFLAGNRMPIIMFFIFLFLFLFLLNIKKLRIRFFLFSISLLVLSIFFVINSDKLNNRAKNFLIGIPNPLIIMVELNKEYPELEKYENSGKPFHTLKEFKTTKNYKPYPFFTGHLQIFLTSIDLFADKPFIGGGIKSFRNNCSKKVHLPNRVCESHPHNFYLEILNDIGIIGLILIISPVLILLKKNYHLYNISVSKKDLLNQWVFLAIITSIFIHFFPFKSTGSFFSTFNAAYFFLLLGISIGLCELNLKKR